MQRHGRTCDSLQHRDRGGRKGGNTREKGKGQQRKVKINSFKSNDPIYITISVCVNVCVCVHNESKNKNEKGESTSVPILSGFSRLACKYSFKQMFKQNTN